MARDVTPTRGWSNDIFLHRCMLFFRPRFPFHSVKKGFVLRAPVKMGVGVGLAGVGYGLGGHMKAVGAK
jgi:hypothetical protein